MSNQCFNLFNNLIKFLYYVHLIRSHIKSTHWEFPDDPVVNLVLSLLWSRFNSLSGKQVPMSHSPPLHSTKKNPHILIAWYAYQWYEFFLHLAFFFFNFPYNLRKKLCYWSCIISNNLDLGVLWMVYVSSKFIC